MKNYFYKVLLSITILVITGCSGTLYLIDKNNKKDTVTYNSLDKSMEVIHNGVLYKGSYVTNSSVGYGSVQNFGKTLH
jgi:cytochrome b involved in lipid metabolism